MLKKINDKEYRAMKKLNHSTLKVFKNEFRYINKILTTDVKPTKSMKFGTMFHSFILEKDKFFETHKIKEFFHIGDKKLNLMLKAHREYIEKNNITLIPQEELDVMKEMRNELRFNPFTNGIIINDNKETEVTNEFKINGIDCKSKIDILIKDEFYDLKTIKTGVIDKDELLKWYIINANYDTQLAFYYKGLQSEGINIDRAGLIFIETKTPYKSRVVYFNSQQLEDIFQSKVMNLLDRYLMYQITGKDDKGLTPVNWGEI